MNQHISHFHDLGQSKQNKVVFVILEEIILFLSRCSNHK